MMSKWQAERAERNRQSGITTDLSAGGSGLGTRPPFPCRRRRGSRWVRFGLPIRSELIGWRERLLLGAGPPQAGAGSSAIIATSMDCPPHIERHLSPIANAHTCKVQDSAVCAANRCIASVGMSIYGKVALTRTQTGTAPV